MTELPRAVLLDLDDTILDDSGNITACWLEACHAHRSALNGLDPIAVHDIQTIVAGLRHRGIGVLITDHNVEQTLDIVDRAYIMFEGQVQAQGSVRDLVFDDRVAQVYLGPTLTARLRARLENAS